MSGRYWVDLDKTNCEACEVGQVVQFRVSRRGLWDAMEDFTILRVDRLRHKILLTPGVYAAEPELEG